VAQNKVLVLAFFKRIQWMAPSFSKLEDVSQVVDWLIHHMASNPPPIKWMGKNAAL
jgi:hypothetical protein